MSFAPITDEQWERVRPLISKWQARGRPRVNDRRTIDGILFVLVGGVPWNYLPSEYGDDSTVNRRFREWERVGLWDLIAAALGVREHPDHPNCARLVDGVQSQAQSL